MSIFPSRLRSAALALWGSTPCTPVRTSSAVRKPSFLASSKKNASVVRWWNSTRSTRPSALVSALCTTARLSRGLSAPDAVCTVRSTRLSNNTDQRLVIGTPSRMTVLRDHVTPQFTACPLAPGWRRPRRGHRPWLSALACPWWDHSPPTPRRAAFQARVVAYTSWSYCFPLLSAAPRDPSLRSPMLLRLGRRRRHVWQWPQAKRLWTE